MSYGVKFRLTFDSVAGNDASYQVDIQQFGYSGEVLSMLGSKEPIIIKQITQQDPYYPSVTTEMTLNLLVPEEERVMNMYGDNINLDEAVSGTTPSNLLLRDDPADDTIFFRADSIGTINAENTTGWVIRDTSTDEQFEIPNSDAATWALTGNRYTVTASGMVFPQWLQDIAYEAVDQGGGRTDYRVRTASWTGTGVATTAEIQRKTSTSVPYYDDFTILRDADDNLDARAYRIIVREEDPDNAGDYIEFKRGFITPQQTSEQFSTFPYVISLKATDGFNLVSNQQILFNDQESVDDSSRVGDYIFNVLHQTGMELPVRVYHDIKTSINDTEEIAIVETQVNDYAYFDEDYLKGDSRIEAARDVARAFNGKWQQGNGYWAITSNSGHSATISEGLENIPYTNYEYNQDTEVWDEGTTVTNESALIDVPTDLVPTGGSMKKGSRRPYFSIEREVEEQYGYPLSVEPYFSGTIIDEQTDLPGNWEWRNSNYGENTTTDSKYVITGTQTPFTTYITSPLFSNEWLLQNILLSDFDRTLGYNIKSKMAAKWDVVADPTIDHVLVYMVLLIRRPSESNSNQYVGYHWGEEAWSAGHNFDFFRDSKRALRNYYKPLKLPIENIDTFLDFDLNIKPLPTDYEAADDHVMKMLIGPIKVVSEFGNFITDHDAPITTYVDSCWLSQEADDNPYEPFWENFQGTFTEKGQFTETYTTKTRIYSEGNDKYRGKLSQEEYYTTDADVTTTLEELVTQQQLDDYREGMVTYQGNYINTSNRVISPVDKILVNYTDGSEDKSGIINKYEFKPRSNTYSLSFYLPDNNDTTGPTTFSNVDVYPANNPYILRGTEVSVNITIDANQWDLGDLTGDIDDYLEIDAFNVDSDTGQWQKTYTGQSGSIVPITVPLKPKVPATQVISFGDLDPIDDADNNRAYPDDLRDPTITDDVDNITVKFADLGDSNGAVMTFDLNMPADSDAITLFLDGAIVDTPSTEGNVTYRATFTRTGNSALQNAYLVPRSRTYEGPPGEVIIDEVQIIPNGGYEGLNTGDWNATSNDTDLVVGTESIEDRNGIQQITLTLPSSSDTGIVNFTGDGPSADDDIPNVEFTLTLAEDSDLVGLQFTNDTEVWDDNAGSNKTVFTNITVLDGYSIKPSDLGTTGDKIRGEVTGDDSSAVTNIEILPGVDGETAQLRCDVKMPSNEENDATITLYGTPRRDPYTLRMNLDLTGTNNTVSDLQFIDVPFNKNNSDDNDQSITPGVFILESNDTTMAFENATDLTVTVTDSEGVVVTYLTGTLTMVADSQQLTLTVAGSFPEIPASGNIVNAYIRVSNGPLVLDATAAGSSLSRADDYGNININGGRFFMDVTANGAWEMYGWDGFGNDGRTYAFDRHSGSNGTYNSIRCTYTNDIFTKSGTNNIYIYLIKAGLLTPAQQSVAVTRQGTLAERNEVQAVLVNLDNQLATRVLVAQTANAVPQPGISANKIEIIEALPDSPDSGVIYIVTG